MDFHAWNVDLNNLSAFHVTGFCVTVEGDPLKPVGVNPAHFPSELSAVEQAKLLRCGMVAIKKAAEAAVLEQNDFRGAARPVG